MEFCVKLLSLPSWERGLKYEMARENEKGDGVAPLVGAWIEILIQKQLLHPFKSLPSWERGLKYGI